MKVHTATESVEIPTLVMLRKAVLAVLESFFFRCKTFLAGLFHGALASMEAANDDTKIMEMSCKRAPSVIVPGAFSHYYLCA